MRGRGQAIAGRGVGHKRQGVGGGGYAIWVERPNERLPAEGVAEGTCPVRVGVNVGVRVEGQVGGQEVDRVIHPSRLLYNTPAVTTSSLDKAMDKAHDRRLLGGSALR